ncbi:MAG: glucosaminidase domain-containing protein [Pseudomonadota bacterium]
MTSVTDFTQYTQLRADARSNEDAALREVAEQFEALFMQQMLKSMRDASFGDPMFPDTGAHGLYRDLLDQQLATDSTQRGGLGLADMIVQQMRLRAASPVPEPVSASPATGAWSSPEGFVAEILPFAREAAAHLGVSPVAVLAHAALETGWGHKTPTSGGVQSLNLFGIKASGSWQGNSVEQATLEFREGVAQRERAAFRAYDSLNTTFDDYVGLLRGSTRYTAALNNGADIGAFGQALQDAGYATDPAYAEKIQRVATGDTMRGVLRALKQHDLLSLTEQIAEPATEREGVL